MPSEQPAGLPAPLSLNVGDEPFIQLIVVDAVEEAGFATLVAKGGFDAAQIGVAISSFLVAADATP